MSSDEEIETLENRLYEIRSIKKEITNCDFKLNLIEKMEKLAYGKI